jgi:hypothetical protein
MSEDAMSARSAIACATAALALAGLMAEPAFARLGGAFAPRVMTVAPRAPVGTFRTVNPGGSGLKVQTQSGAPSTAPISRYKLHNAWPTKY